MGGAFQTVLGLTTPASNTTLGTDDDPGRRASAQRPLLGRSVDGREGCVERAAAVARQVERESHGRDRVVFDFPGPVVLDPTDARMVGHPAREHRFADPEREPIAAADALEPYSELL